MKDDEDFLNRVEAPPAAEPAAEPSAPPGGAAPAPVSTPAATPSPTTPAPAAPAAGAEPPKPGAPAPAAPAGAAPPASAPTPPVAPAAEPEPVAPFSVELQTPAQPQPAAPSPPPKVTAEQLVAQLTPQYVFDEQTREALLDDVPGTLPKILAQQHVRVAQEVLGSLQRILPVLVQNVMRQGETRQTFTQKFYGRWPALRQHHKLVDNALRSYRAVNPGATLNELMEKVGLMAMVELKLPIEGISPPTATPAPEPAAFTPAAPAGRTPPPAAEKNIWTQFVEDAD